MKKLLASVLVGFSLLASTAAHAWGPLEQGILTGVAGLWTFQQLSRIGQPQPVVVYQQPPVIYQAPVQVTPPVVYQPQQYCEWFPVTDQFGNARSVQYCYWK